jgi:hypothetical protein
MGRLFQSVMIVLRNTWRVTRQTFHEVAGAMFAVFGFSGVIAAVRSWQHRQTPWLAAAALAYAAMMAIFSALSFRSSRRVR